LPFTYEGKAATNQTVVEAQAAGADRVGVEHFVLALLVLATQAVGSYARVERTQMDFVVRSARRFREREVPDVESLRT
jgi:hypothetical protein